MPLVLLLTGTCGSGKSTVAQCLAERHGWARVSEDDLWQARCHRRRGEPGSEEHRQRRAVVRAEVMARVRAAVSAGRDVVVDATVHEATSDSLGDYVALLEADGLEWSIRVLHPRLEVAVARDARRPDWSAGAAGVETLWRKFTGERFGGEAFLDTSDETPEASAARVLASLPDEATSPGRNRASPGPLAHAGTTGDLIAMDWQAFPGHDRLLETRRLLLRPFRESDLEVERRYYADPVLRAAFEEDADAATSPEQLRAAALYLASWGYLFALELKAERRTVGEACLERMNLERAEARPGERVFRLPIAIWDRRLWGQGLGGEALDRLLAEAFAVEAADRVCAMDVKRSNARSRGLFESRGFRVVRELGEVLDLELTRATYARRDASRARQEESP